MAQMSSSSQQNLCDPEYFCHPVCVELFFGTLSNNNLILSDLVFIFWLMCQILLPVSKICINRFINGQLKDFLHMHGLGRHTKEEQQEIGLKCLGAVSKVRSSYT